MITPETTSAISPAMPQIVYEVPGIRVCSQSTASPRDTSPLPARSLLSARRSQDSTGPATPADPGGAGVLAALPFLYPQKQFVGSPGDNLLL